jgi:hypothetical protein
MTRVTCMAAILGRTTSKAGVVSYSLHLGHAGGRVRFSRCVGARMRRRLVSPSGAWGSWAGLELVDNRRGAMYVVEWGNGARRTDEACEWLLAMTGLSTGRERAAV